MRSLISRLCLCTLVSGISPAFCADPQLPFWSGRLADKTRSAGFTHSASEKADTTDKHNVDNDADEKYSGTEPADKTPEKSPEPAEPEWLRKLDKNDRATLTGGWALQNLSGGTSSLTTAGDRRGYYAPNSNQGSEFQRWNNVATRQDIPSWNGRTTGYPAAMWSQGYTSSNTYFGADAQRWGNMSSGGMTQNRLSGGWSMSVWP